MNELKKTGMIVQGREWECQVHAADSEVVCQGLAWWWKVSKERWKFLCRITSWVGFRYIQWH